MKGLSWLMKVLRWNRHTSHLVTSAVASWRAVGQKKPCRNAFPARALDPMWEPHMPPCISANTPVLPPGGCTSISRRSAFSCTGRHRRTGTGRTDGLLSPLLPAPREAPLFGGIGRYAAPMPEPGARRQGPKASLTPWERLSLRLGLDALPEPVAPGQAQCAR